MNDSALLEKVSTDGSAVPSLSVAVYVTAGGASQVTVFGTPEADTVKGVIVIVGDYEGVRFGL